MKTDEILKPLSSFRPEALARRECPSCRVLFPPELDQRHARVLSIVGLNIAGKTNFLSTAITLARNGGLADFGVTEFAPDLDTAQRFQRDYMIPLFRERKVLSGTRVDMRVATKPLGFRITSAGVEPYLLATHDIAGEALVDHRLRATSASFIRRSRGMIFLLDPLEFDPIRDRMNPAALPASRGIDQADLLEQILRELDRRVPLAIVIGKADILVGLNGYLQSYRSERNPGEPPIDDLARVSAEVKDFLQHIGQQRIVQLGADHGMTTFHAVSSLGGSPAEVALNGVRPKRVLDPLGVVLHRMATLSRSR